MFSFFFFLFKQKTAYEMRISDWSSDVCSSDLGSSAITEKLCPWGAGNCWKRATSARKGLAQPESARRAAAGAAMIAIFLNKLIRAILSRHQAECRSEERRVGKECGSTCRSGWSRKH